MKNKKNISSKKQNPLETLKIKIQVEKEFEQLKQEQIKTEIIQARKEFINALLLNYQTKELEGINEIIQGFKKGEYIF